VSSNRTGVPSEGPRGPLFLRCGNVFDGWMGNLGLLFPSKSVARTASLAGVLQTYKKQEEVHPITLSAPLRVNQAALPQNGSTCGVCFVRISQLKVVQRKAAAGFHLPCSCHSSGSATTRVDRSEQHGAARSSTERGSQGSFGDKALERIESI
jgi:hypothetical protein